MPKDVKFFAKNMYQKKRSTVIPVPITVFHLFS